MGYSHNLILVCILFCLQSTLCSYLDYPRIHFAGKFRVDSTAINNYPCNYRMDHDVKYSYPPDIHDYGSNSFEFYDSKVTATVNASGALTEQDNLNIVTNINKPFTKLVDLDVDCQMHSTLYGMEFGIQDASGVLLLYGKWTPCVIANNLWPQINCFSDVEKCLLKYSPSGESFGAQSATTLTDVKWAEDLPTWLADLKEKAGDSLAVRITMHGIKYSGNEAEIGWVEGIIGIPSEEDTLCIPGQRMMYPVNDAQPQFLSYNICDHCIYRGQDITQGKQWMGQTPFQVNYKEDSTADVIVDFGASVVMDTNRNVRDLEGLFLVVIIDDNDYRIIGRFQDYASKDTYIINGGVYVFPVSDGVDLLKSHPLGVVQVPYEHLTGDAFESRASEFIGVASSGLVSEGVVLLKEHQYYIRPKGYYVGRLDSKVHPKDTQKAYITSYGFPPANITSTVNTMLSQEVANALPTMPPNGVVGSFRDYNSSTGIATFEFQKAAKLQALRIYGQPICPGDDRVTLPIDGQVYWFYYGIEGVDDPAFQDIQTVYLAFSDIRYNRPYTWVDDVGPIFTQYARLTPMMKTILDLSNYRDVARPRNINLLKKNLRLNFSEPGYMPTTRDLSPAKRAMILEWLDSPIYDNHCHLPLVIGQPQQQPGLQFDYKAQVTSGHPNIPSGRCDNTESKAFGHEIFHTDSHFRSAFLPPSESSKCYHIKTAAGDLDDVDFDLSTLILELAEERPLVSNSIKQSRNLFSEESVPVELECSKSAIIKQLQTALRLEWATLPTYLTTLYSIPSGCNIEIYNLIRLIIMQEMFHFALVGNMLISLGAVPEIDSPNFAPKYPGPLPGCVLPGLEVTLEKLSLEHIHDVFMMIELPAETDVIDNMTQHHVFTIGKFYEEIEVCIKKELNDDDFGNEEFQVTWKHWDPNSMVGTLSPITNKESAIEAIKTIVSQGEGSGLLNPKDIADKTYAHFFKFEEMYCGHHIKQTSDTTYAYSGHPIFFDPMGVAPMRPNPSTEDIPPDTLCYTESRVFHTAYRNFLRKLQEVYNGNPKGKPDDIFVAVQLMEALQLNAKRLMWINFDGTQTCGPVWDYEFYGDEN